MMPPQTGLEIIVKAIFYNDFAPLALGIGNWMASRTNTCAIPNGVQPATSCLMSKAAPRPLRLYAL
jgi:hypothetical protein